MSSPSMTNITDAFDTLFRLGPLGDLSDGELLRRLATAEERAARAILTLLVTRHGAMVLNVCRAALGDAHDAQDAFQATFLILARKAGTIREDCAAGWLHGVVVRVCRRVWADAARRRVFERKGVAMRADRPWVEADASESWEELHEEVNRLPRRYREVIVLCYLEGVSTEAAASRIGCPRGTVLSRLARARDRLRASLLRRGLSPAGLLAPACPPVPRALIEATVRVSTEFATRGMAGAASVPAITLATEVLRIMMIFRMKVLAATALAGIATLGGAGTLASQLARAPGPRPMARGLHALPANAAPVGLMPADEPLDVLREALRLLEEQPRKLSATDLADIAEAQAKLGDREGAKATLRKASEVAAAAKQFVQKQGNSTMYGLSSAHQLWRVGRVQVMLDDREAARATLRKALDAPDEEAPASMKIETWIDVAKELVTIGAREDIHELLLERSLTPCLAPIKTKAPETLPLFLRLRFWDPRARRRVDRGDKFLRLASQFKDLLPTEVAGSGMIVD